VTISGYKRAPKISVTGANTVDPKTGVFAKNVNICSGKVATCTEGGPGFLHKQPVDALNGTWQFNGKGPGPTQVTAISEFGGKYTAEEFRKPPTEVKPPPKAYPENKNSNTDRFQQKGIGVPEPPTASSGKPPRPPNGKRPDKPGPGGSRPGTNSKTGGTERTRAGTAGQQE
jgi:hypothetical protein